MKYGLSAGLVGGGGDKSTNTLFWEAGSPGNDYNGDQRLGDNLCSDCILALDPATGRLKWYFQTTPHDVWVGDATKTPLIIDAPFACQARKLLVQANRDGFFCVLDRGTGKLRLRGRSLTISPGREASMPKDDHGLLRVRSRMKPARVSARPTNRYSPSYSPATGLFYVQTAERCSIDRKCADGFQAGRSVLEGAITTDADPKPAKILRAIDVFTEALRWQLRQVGTSNSSGGTLTTSSGLVVFGEDSGALAAADAVTGKMSVVFPVRGQLACIADGLRV